jgi:hypothetical protein
MRHLAIVGDPTGPETEKRVYSCSNYQHMKSIGSSLVFLLLGSLATAQTDHNVNPELKTGVVLEYSLSAQGQTIPLVMKISQIGPDGIVLDYDVMGNTGKFINSAINLEKGTSLNWDEVSPGEERKLPDDQTLGMVSRSFLKELKSKKKATYDNQLLELKDVPAGDPLTAGGKPLQIVYAESDGGSTRYWILDNEDFPLLLRIEGNMNGINITLKDIH